MDLDRPHHHRNTSTELFLCFTSRLSSSSSMKISRSILSPARSRDHHPMSLPTSLSRRLRSNGSIKAGQASPMFPPAGKKRGSALDNPEPSSPKVTCIGQVRVKTKKKAKQTRSLSRRRSAGDVSFRRVTERQSGDNSFSSLGGGCDENGFAGSGQAPHGYMRANSTAHQHQHECLPHRNQRWVHLPLTICETLRAFGAEFSCLFPCRSSCFSTSERGKDEKGDVSREGNNRDDHRQSSCGAVFARWLVTLQDGEGGKGREIELVVGGEERSEVRERIDDDDDDNDIMRTSRRHVLEDFKINEEKFDGKGPGEEEEEARVSICIPPKNALLLMRCRSDPMKMAALTNRFWEAPPPQDEEDEEEEEINVVSKEIFGEEVVKEINGNVPRCEAAEKLNEISMEEIEMPDPNAVEEVERSDSCGKVEDLPVNVHGEKAEKVESCGVEQEDLVRETEPERIQLLDKEKVVEATLATTETLQDNFNKSEEVEEDDVIISEKEVVSRISCSSFSSAFGEGKEDDEVGRISCSSYTSASGQGKEYVAAEEAPLGTETPLKEDGKVATNARTESTCDEDTQETGSQLECQSEVTEDTNEGEEVEDKEMDILELKKSETEEEHVERRDRFMMENEGENGSRSPTLVSSAPSASVLPDCLLLMMYEPKLSMEVSKETWVCSTDFTRWLPQRHRQVKPSAAKKNTSDSDVAKKRVAGDSYNENSQLVLPNQPPPKPPMVPPRSSCSLPVAAVSMATMIEQKLVNGVGYEPFVLTRCKSEPMRTAAKTSAPDTCYWAKRKLEPLRRAAFHVGATGVGF